MILLDEEYSIGSREEGRGNRKEKREKRKEEIGERKEKSKKVSPPERRRVKRREGKIQPS
ncbi:MAG: hypothetical protein JRE28_14650 [Deltaproteobacteria bacterium]|nr:hypothetical protein [Deltaproteobacteria bacterium]